MENEKKKGWRLFRFIRRLIDLFYPTPEIVGAENIPTEGAVIVGNHCQMNGPIVAELYIPCRRLIWCAGEMMEKELVAEYAFRDFWSFKPKRVQWFYKILSHIIVPFSTAIFNNAQTIPVWHDSRVLTTFRKSAAALKEGCKLIIFPEKNEPYNNILYDFQDKFIDVARLCKSKNGGSGPLAFIPMYIAPKLRKVVIGKPTYFDASAPMDAERQRIKSYLMDEICALAYALPRHTVVPYRNIRKRDYPLNVPREVEENEKA